jgi:hypothetical protein
MIVKIIYPEGGREDIEVESSEITVGRGATNDIMVTDDQISRVHLSIKLTDSTLFIKDMTLSNWVSYNEEKLSKVDYVQYFDFAKLVLPGGISLKISLGGEDEITTDTASLERSLRTSTSIKKPSVKNESTIRSSSENPRTRDRKSRELKSKDEKGMKEFLIMAFVLVAVGGFLTFKLMNKNPLPVVKLTPGYKKSLKKNIKKSNETTDTPVEFKATFASFSKDSKKCNSDFEKKICKLISSQISTGEGVVIMGQTVFIFKGVNRSGMSLFETKKRYEKSKGNRSLMFALAAHNVLKPSTISTLKSLKVGRIIIFLYEGTKNQILKDQFFIKRLRVDDLKISRYRRSMKKIKQAINFEIFDQEIKNQMNRIK